MNKLMIIVGVITIFILLLSWLWKAGRQPYKNKRKCADNLKEFFQLLLSNGRNGAHLFIDIPKIHGFIQFLKLDSRHFQCDFPDAPWSACYFEKAVACAKEIEVSYAIESTGRRDIKRFLVINFYNDIAKAQLFTNSILYNAFQLSKDDSIILWLDNVDVIVRKKKLV